MDSTANTRPDAVNAETGVINLDIQEVRYSLPMMLRELQLERTHSFLAKEIIDQIEISKLFAQARKARATRKKP